MSKFVIRPLVLSLIIIGCLFWTNNAFLNHYNLQLTAVIVLLYFVSKLFIRKVTQSLYFTAIILVSTVSLLIFSTGGISSPIFFMFDFLLFAIALLISPYQSLFTSLTLIIIFVFKNFTDLTSENILNLVSIALMTPLAIIFGKTYLSNLQSEGKITILKETIKDEQAESLLWISTSAKPSLSSALNSLTDVVVYLNSKSQSLLIPPQLLNKLKTIQKDLIALYSSTNTLEKSIEESSDKIDI